MKKIVILGAGQVGSSVAAILSSEGNDVTVVDRDTERLQVLQDRYDLRTVAGHGSHPSVLEQAGTADADMVLAVTNSDETNMVACQVAYTLFRTPTKIARVRAADYLRHQEALFAQEALPVDVIISPEKLVTEYIQRLIEHPGALQVLDFADGRVRLVAMRAYYGGPLVGKALRALREHLPEVDTRVAAIFRRDKPILPEGDTVIEADDEVFFVAAAPDIRRVMSELRRLERPVHNVLIAGGGNIGTALARRLEDDYNVKLIERDRGRAQRIAEVLDRTVVLQGDAADEELLREENIDHVDVFCAVTNEDEANILSAMLAKRLGARKVMALINRPAYVDLVESGPIDIAVSPQQATVSGLLTHVRRGDVVMAHPLRRGAAEAIEAVVHGDRATSKVAGRRIDEIPLPRGTTIGAVVRGHEVLMAHHDLVVEPGDHVILFLVDKRRVPEVERLFQVSATFL
ncbi:Trk system potassium transporter TrkA [Inmirania thermothiophila]|uniref:Trk system potassium uptake protein TrkA n=1 Tax=Inmirania thermothiophila TaxID=1750597 RepID=A0A3N1YA20_9GAMM|nr:Trk system potassium transporter TrkA [Inmirania thermothiophila]ROR34247.1 trk system potassium uptake protein TrkA [Inmirania thermothiophila]